MSPPSPSGVTSTEDLLGWRTLRVAVWVMALVTLFANVVVIFCRAISRKDNKILKLFVKNLAVLGHIFTLRFVYD
ncbi:Relaxin receptor 2 [Portunus trituberculatus]|uniref:Relaxin receptor 2 n=1 Tax=Portunus trituberculatus TaxID=210409 RepID=A0A5B7K936_PORTR|nr:Relaxin receptor 2 [Portunus trituberculatus]